MTIQSPAGVTGKINIRSPPMSTPAGKFLFLRTTTESLRKPLHAPAFAVLATLAPQQQVDLNLNKLP